MERQLDIQKKKNEQTKNIFKAEINKLKTTKSFEGFNDRKNLLETVIRFLKELILPQETI